MLDNHNLLEVEGLTKSYGKLMAVDHISFTVKRGEVFGLLGPNGAGKTTAISMLCGLLKPDSGKVSIDNIALSKNYNKAKSIVGLCPQNIVIWELLTCMEQLVFSGVSYGMTRRQAKESSEFLLGKLGLIDQKNKLAKALSGGMQRRLNIALALVHDPKLIILDEPQAGLDPQSRILVRDFVRELSKDKTVILTTHDMDEADRLSDRVAIVDHGKFLIIDTPERIKNASGSGDILQIRVNGLNDRKISDFVSGLSFESRDVSYADGLLYISAQDIVRLVPEISEVIESQDMTIQDMTIRKRTLEDAFIAMTGRGLRE
ncbi:MAG: ABC transporter ATP-binding protein [Vallitaleaceae bacterium]|jgi:ABC-2 type transport system ATP-binding protein|nr:ABC transporter ATP-binding protein [Vallitaleaceae bacterium]